MIVDLHLHILPGVDDGAGTMEEAVQMAYTAFQSGVNHAVATPHYDFYQHSYEQTVQDAFLRLKDQLAFEQIPLQLSLAAEHFACPRLPQRLQKEGTYPNSRYFLVEFPLQAQPCGMNDLLEACATEGFIPVVAHPERYYAIQEHPHYAREWAEKGWGVQINRDSLTGLFGPDRFYCADLLLQKGWANIIASDAHDVMTRNTCWDRGLGILSQRYPPELLHRCLYQTPMAVLQDKPID